MPNLNMPGEGGARPPVQPMVPGRDTGGLIKKLIILGVVIILGGGGFFLYQSGLLPFGKKEAAPPPPPAEVIPPPEEMATPPAPGTAMTPAAETKPPGESKPSTQPPSMKPMGKGDFTVVIHSFSSRKIAEDEATRWSNAGFPAMVTEKNVGGSMWYRVAIGRYETRQLAKKAGKEMEHMLESGYWVDRVH